MGKFFGNNMSCVYLDQFAVSNIANEQIDDQWQKIYQLLNAGVEKRKIICPISFEHYIETARRPIEKAIVQDQTFKALSFGWSFLTEPFVACWQILTLIRKLKPSKHHYIEKRKHNAINQCNNYQELNNLNSNFNEIIADGSEMVNRVRQLCRDGKKGDKKLLNQLVNIIKQKTSEELIVRIQKLLKDGQYRTDPLTIAGQSIPHWADVILATLTRKHRIKNNELVELLKILNNGSVEKIPALNIRSSLSALSAYKQMQETANDQIDIMRISGALPLADMMVIDRSKKAALDELGLPENYQTQIYSGQSTELNKFIKELENII